MKSKIKIPTFFKNRKIIGAIIVIFSLFLCLVVSPYLAELEMKHFQKVNTTPPKVSNNYSIYHLKNGQILVSVTVKNFADSLSGKLQAGDIVSAAFPPAASNAVGGSSSQADAQFPLELRYLKVVAVTAASGGDTTEAEVKKAASSSNSNNLPATVTVLCNERQYQIFVGHENDTAHFGLRCRGDTSLAQKLLKEQADYFKLGKSSSAAAPSSSSGASNNNTSSNNSQNMSASNPDNSLNMGGVQ